MKKVFTFIVSAILAGSAMAAPKQLQMRPGEVSPIQKLTPAQIEMCPVLGNMKTEAPEGMQRLMTDGSQNTWNMAVYLLGEAATGLGLGHYENENDPDSWVYDTFDDFPMYVVQIPMGQMNTTEATECSFSNVVLWPCRSYMYTDLVNMETGDIYWDKATTKFGSLEAAKAPMSIDEAMDYCKALYQTTNARIPVMYGFWSVYVTSIDFSILSSQSGYVWKGTGYDVQASTFTTSGPVWNSYIELRAYDPDMKEITAEGMYKLGVRNSSTGVVTATTTANFVLSGSPALIGFAPIMTEDFALHIFDCGLVDTSSMWGMNYDVDFEPVHRYFAMWCDPDMSYIAYDAEENIHYAWDKETIADLSLKKPYPVSPYGFTNTEVRRWFNATLFTAADATTLEGLWTMPEPKYEFNSQNGAITKWLSVPTPHELVAGGYKNANSEQDGFSSIIDLYYVYPDPGMAAIGVGDATYGFNYKFTADGWGDNVVMGSTTLPCYFHYDSTDFDKMEQKPTVGTADANVIDADLSGVEVVESNAPVVSTQYFNLQGQRLNVAPQQGIFIQREIKADGTVKATKVAK